jgi:DNA repair exonuclease SbcCD ATPase subunit
MAKPLPVSDPLRAASNGAPLRPGDRRAEGRTSHANPAPVISPGSDETLELERLRDENNQLRALCLELEQALQEAATGGGDGDGGQSGGSEQLREYEALLEEKSETIRQLHQHVEEIQTALTDAESRLAESAEQEETAGRRAANGPAPREEELLALSEELERERRQLQEDEQTLMDQMREMEVCMARERAELARQRNDLQRLQAEVRHELERLERNGALQNKIDSLKSKLQDVTARRGAARGDVASGPASAPPPPVQPAPPPAGVPGKGQGLMGRLFGQGGGR